VPDVFVSLRDITVAPSADLTTLTFTVWTDLSIQLRYRVWLEQNPSVSAAGNDAAASVGKHLFPYPLGPLATPADLRGKIAGFEILSATPQTQPYLRSYVGSVRMPGARDPFDIPVRFFSFSGPMTGAVPTLGTLGNWSRYTWSQWNPKST